MLALDRCADVDLDPDVVVRNFDVVCGALGADWLEEEAAKSDRVKSIASRHPLYRELSSSTPQALVLVCELAEYLGCFLGDPAIKTVIEDLRSAKYESSFLELAMAYRWHQVCPPVRLHPPTPSGVADFEVSVSGLRLVVEASVFPADLLSDARFRLAQMAEGVARQELAGGSLAALKVVIERYPEGNFEALLRESIVDACRRFVSDGRGPLDERRDEWSISLETIDPLAESNPLDLGITDLNAYGGINDWDVMLSVGGIPKVEGTPAPRVVSDRETVNEEARIFMRFPRLKGTPADKVRKKLKREAQQLRGIRDARAIVLDVTGIEVRAFEATWPQISGELLTQMRSIRELCGVWLLRRGFTKRSRYGYGGRYLPNSQSIYRIPESLIQRLQNVERRLAFPLTETTVQH